MEDEVFKAFLARYGKIYNPDANEAALAERREVDERRAELKRLYPAAKHW